MRNTVLFLMGALIIVSVSSCCATTESFSYKTKLYKIALHKQKLKLESKCKIALLNQQSRLELKAGIESYRSMIATAESELEWRQMVRPIILTMAKLHKSREAIEALRQIDERTGVLTKILKEMKIQLQKGLELQRRHRYLR